MKLEMKRLEQRVGKIEGQISAIDLTEVQDKVNTLSALVGMYVERSCILSECAHLAMSLSDDRLRARALRGILFAMSAGDDFFRKAPPTDEDKKTTAYWLKYITSQMNDA